MFEDPHVETTFIDHLENEHNVWNYGESAREMCIVNTENSDAVKKKADASTPRNFSVCFIVYLASKSKTDLTGTEQYVIEELNQNRITWFPMGRALVTEGKQADDEEGAGDGIDYAQLVELLESKRPREGARDEKLDEVLKILTTIKDRDGPQSGPASSQTPRGVGLMGTDGGGGMPLGVSASPVGAISAATPRYGDPGV